MSDNHPLYDKEIMHLVCVLNAHGYPTVASCSGHGHRPGRITLADGREIIIAKGYEEAQAIEGLFNTDIHGVKRPTLSDVIELLRMLRLNHPDRRDGQGVRQLAPGDMTCNLWANVDKILEAYQ